MLACLLIWLRASSILFSQRCSKALSVCHRLSLCEYLYSSQVCPLPVECICTSDFGLQSEVYTLFMSPAGAWTTSAIPCQCRVLWRSEQVNSMTPDSQHLYMHLMDQSVDLQHTKSSFFLGRNSAMLRAGKADCASQMCMTC